MQPQQPAEPQQPFQPQQPLQSPQPLQQPQPVAAAPAPNPEHPAHPTPAHQAEHHSNAGAVEHVSNPYIAATNGLVTMLKTNPVAAMLSVVLGLLISMPLFIPVFITSPKNGDDPNPLNIVLTIAWYLLLIPLITGTSIAVASASAKEEKITTRQALSAAIKKALPLIGLLLLTLIFAGLAMLLLVIPGLIVLARTSLAPIVLFQENLGPIAAIKRSFALTKGHFFEVWGAMISGSLLAGYGLLSPATSVAPLLERYQQYASIEAGKTTASKTHWLNYFNVFVPIILVGLLIAIVAATYDKVSEKYDTDRTPQNTPTYQYNTPDTDFNYDFN